MSNMIPFTTDLYAIFKLEFFGVILISAIERQREVVSDKQLGIICVL